MRLLFITSTRIGDAVLSSGLLAHLIQNSPECRVTIACGVDAVPVFEAVPGIERIIPIKKYPVGMHWPQLWLKLVAKRWNIVVDLRSSLISWLLIANQRLVLHRKKENVHRVVEIGSLVDSAKIPAPCLWIPQASKLSANAVLPKDKFIVIAPTANWRGKQWPGDRFAELARRIVSENGVLPGASVVILGAHAERVEAQCMVDYLSEIPFVNLVGELKLMASAAVIQKSSLFIGNDSALMHIAAAAGVPTLGLFGPSKETHYAPWGINCGFQRTLLSYDNLTSSKGYNHLTTDTLMGSLTVDMAEEAVRSLWSRVNIK